MNKIYKSFLKSKYFSTKYKKYFDIYELLFKRFVINEERSIWVRLFFFDNFLVKLVITKMGIEVTIKYIKIKIINFGNIMNEIIKYVDKNKREEANLRESKCASLINVDSRLKPECKFPDFTSFIYSQLDL